MVLLQLEMPADLNRTWAIWKPIGVGICGLAVATGWLLQHHTNSLYIKPRSSSSLVFSYPRALDLLMTQTLNTSVSAPSSVPPTLTITSDSSSPSNSTDSGLDATSSISETSAQGKPKGCAADELLFEERFWRDKQPWLLERGYRLRPRYAPDWTPSWWGTDKEWTECEDGVTNRVSSFFPGVTSEKFPHFGLRRKV